MFVIPTIRFQVLNVFIILGLDRRRLIFATVTTNPTAEWLAQQVVNAYPEDTAPRFLARDRDRAYGLAFRARVKGLGGRPPPRGLEDQDGGGHHHQHPALAHRGSW